MKNGNWLKLHRSILSSDVFDNPKILKVWIWCLCKASHKKHKVSVGLQTVELDAGQFVFGRKVASQELHIPESSLMRYMRRLESVGNLNIKTNNKFSLITIENWRFYQGDASESGQENEQQMDIKWTPNGHQMDTYKNGKTGKKGKNDSSYNLDDRRKQIAQLSEQVLKEMEQ